jgi:mono/diheme cytochrome c family protein
MTSKERNAALIGAGAVVLVAAIAAELIATVGAYDVAADKPHTTLVANVLQFVRNRSIDVRATGVTVPPLSAHMVADGASDYDEMCTGCHLAPGLSENEMRPGMNPKPPRLAEGAAGNPARQFWVIKHGVKMSGMPAWGVTHADAEIWNVVAFLQALPKLSPAQYRQLVKSAAGHHEHQQGRDIQDGHMDMGH